MVEKKNTHVLLTAHALKALYLTRSGTLQTRKNSDYKPLLQTD